MRSLTWDNARPYIGVVAIALAIFSILTMGWPTNTVDIYKIDNVGAWMCLTFLFAWLALSIVVKLTMLFKKRSRLGIWSITIMLVAVLFRNEQVTISLSWPLLAWWLMWAFVDLTDGVAMLESS